MSENAPVSRSVLVNNFFQENYETLQRWALQITAFDRGLAEDILHDAFLRLQKTPAKGTDDFQNIDGYVYTALRNSYRSHFREGRRRSFHLSVHELEITAPQLIADDPSSFMRTQDDLRAVCKFACKRKEQSIAASILILRFFHGYYPGEISRLLNRSRNAVETRLLRIRREAINYLSGVTKDRQDSRPEVLSASTQPRIHIDLIAELQRKIFDCKRGECMPADHLKRLHRKNALGPDREEISHLVSCRECLDRISTLLRLPTLADRHPFDALRVQSTVDSMQFDRKFRLSAAIALTSQMVTSVLISSEFFAQLVS